jgi:hypothetical protein
MLQAIPNSSEEPDWLPVDRRRGGERCEQISTPFCASDDGTTRECRAYF